MENSMYKLSKLTLFGLIAIISVASIQAGLGLGKRFQQMRRHPWLTATVLGAAATGYCVWKRLNQPTQPQFEVIEATLRNDEDRGIAVHLDVAVDLTLERLYKNIRNLTKFSTYFAYCLAWNCVRPQLQRDYDFTDLHDVGIGTGVTLSIGGDANSMTRFVWGLWNRFSEQRQQAQQQSAAQVPTQPQVQSANDQQQQQLVVANPQQANPQAINPTVNNNATQNGVDAGLLYTAPYVHYWQQYGSPATATAYEFIKGLRFGCSFKRR